MEPTQILQELLGQSIICGMLGFGLYKIWNAYISEKDKKDIMAEALIKLTQSWEDRYSKESTDDREIKEFMKEIRDFVRDIQHGKRITENGK